MLNRRLFLSTLVAVPAAAMGYRLPLYESLSRSRERLFWAIQWKLDATTVAMREALNQRFFSR